MFEKLGGMMFEGYNSKAINELETPKTIIYKGEQCRCGKWREMETELPLPEDATIELPYGLYLCQECKDGKAKQNQSQEDIEAR